MIRAYPKIFALGSKQIHDIWQDTVVIEEKVDGSQLVFGKDKEGVLRIRSRGKEMFFEAPTKMFIPAAEYVQSIADRIPRDTFFYGEYLRIPKHNTLAYQTIPKNHIALFGVCRGLDYFVTERAALEDWAKLLGIDVVPLLFHGVPTEEPFEFCKKLLENDSFLGNVKIEGVVVKNYNHSTMIGGQIIPMLMGKFVSEAFKEKHTKNWKVRTGKGQWEEFCEAHRTEARWQKAVQHLRDKDELIGEPKDIGSLVKEIQRDITEEEKEAIKNFLWSCYGKDLLRTAIKGFPEWYKEQLLKGEIVV